MKSLHFAQITDRGRVRETNEDSLDAVVPDAPLRLSQGSWFVIADGLGGLPDGERASREAVAAFREGASAAGSFQFPSTLEALFTQANLHVCALNTGKARWLRMATTLTVSLFLNEKLLIGHVGDCRVYRIRSKRIERLTEDQSLDRHTLTQALGLEPHLAPAFYEESLREGDRYLQCSDGVHGVLEDRALLDLFSIADAEEACANLVRAVHTAGAPDNVTAQIIQII